MLGRKTTLAVLMIFTTLTLSCSEFLNTDKDAVASPRPPTGDSTNKPLVLPEFFSKPNDGEFSVEKMLVNMGANVAAPAVEKFAASTVQLMERIEGYCEKVESEDPDLAQELETVKTAWSTSMLQYHQLEAVSFGPEVKGQIPFRELIYSWPNFNMCGIDDDVAKIPKGILDQNNWAPNRRGLGALEYLIFTETAGCEHPKTFKNLKVWIEKPAQEQKVDRCRATLLIAKDLVKQAKAVDRLWDADVTNLSARLVDKSLFPDINKSVNMMSDSLFAIEKIKDFRLGAPLGLHANCTADSKKCPEKAEHPWSGMAIKAIIAQLQGFQVMFHGHKNTASKAFSFDDYLTSLGHSEVVTQMEKDVNVAIATAVEMDKKGTLQQQVEAMDVTRCQATSLENPAEPICYFQKQVREAANAYKTTVLSVLSLQAPAGSGPSDAD